MSLPVNSEQIVHLTVDNNSVMDVLRSARSMGMGELGQMELRDAKSI